MSDDLEFIVIDDIPEYIFCIGDDEENEQVIALSGKDGAFKYEKVDELPTTGEDGVLYLVPKSHTTQTASGNPINVNITDNAGKIESLKLDGDTFQQTYTGKNLIDIKDNLKSSDGGLEFSYSNNELHAVGTTSRPYANITDNISVSLAAGSYTLSISKVLSHRVYLHVVYTDDTSADLPIINAGETFKSATFAKDVKQVRLDFSLMGTGTAIDESFSVQLEKSSTATDYEPYVGGVPSPNPSYPQQIQIVTGTQTISINGTDYPIDLGSIELCKLVTYQDYIYKSGSDWKVHKTTNKVDVSDLTGWYASGSHTIKGTWAGLNIQTLVADTGYSSHFTRAYANALYNGSTPIGFAVGSDGLYFSNNDWTLTQFTTFIGNNSVVLYGALTTATDTTITDTNLIAQLEAIRTAALESGSNTISNTATGTNLAGDLEIGYYGYDPLNKYDKYFWLDVDGAYESL